MNIGIITFHSAHNYGAMLQTFALQTYLKKELGINVKVIDFRTEAGIQAYEIFKRPNTLRQYFNEFLKLLHYKELKKGYDSFEQFLNNYIETTERYATYQSLIENPPEFDVYISGSDQVFSPKGKELNAYYLNFGPKHIKRIAYAPSFGYKTVPDNMKKQISILLNRFNRLSAREISGCEIIKELTGKDVPNVVDPVFLLNPEHYHDIAKPVKIKYKKYILCYSLVGIKKQTAIAGKLKELTGLPIILLKPSASLSIKGIDKTIRSAGPLEFLWLFENAAFVVTDSFHGTAFSLVFKKNFFSAIAFPEKAERIYSILNEIGLNDRIIDNPTEITKNNLEINYHIPSKKLEEKINASKEYLKKSLQ